MKIAIVDDEKCWRDKVEKTIRGFYKEDTEISVFESGVEYLNGEEQYDITFMDIEMPDVDGFDTIAKAREYNANGIYIILTTHTEMSRKGYMVNAFRYIDKINLQEELEEALKSVDILIGRNDKLEVNVIEEGVREITLKNIIYIETEKHYLLLHTRQGVKRCSNSLLEIQNMLRDKPFYRCHHAYIVNLDEIKKIQDTDIHMSNGDKLYVSIRRKAEFKQKYLNRLYECANA